MQMRQIGIVRNDITTQTDTNWGAVRSEILLDPDYRTGLAGLSEFSHAIVIFWMHESEWNPREHLTRRPRGRTDLSPVGIFAQRAKHRPNPIGITTVRILDVQGDSLTVVGLDAIDGTPVIDIKPYVPQFDRPESSHGPDWMNDIMKDYF
jgi:tRNA-Thr(GGU) m(6)t(6)A37 methyltransferase TsaA